MQELLLSNDFRRYRKLMISEIAIHIQSLLNGSFEKTTGFELKGAMDMARKIIRLPTSFTMAKELKDRIKAETMEDFKEFETKFIRSHLIDDSN